MNISLRLEVTCGDAKKIINWLENKNITKYLNEDINSIDKINDVIQCNQADLLTYYLNQDGRFFLIDLNDECIGFINLFTIKRSKEYEVVIAIGDENNWGRQYAKKALEKILKEVFFSWRIDKLYAKIIKENTRSIALFEHLNFKKEPSSNGLIKYCIDYNSFLDWLHMVE